jgi:hypothetical protein
VFEQATAPHVESIRKGRDSCDDGCGFLVWCSKTTHIKSDFLKNREAENLLQRWPVKQLATSRIFNSDMHTVFKTDFHDTNSSTSTQHTETISVTAAASDSPSNTPLGAWSSKVCVPDLLSLDPTNDDINNFLVSKIKASSILDFKMRCTVQPSFSPSTG